MFYKSIVLVFEELTNQWVLNKTPTAVKILSTNSNVSRIPFNSFTFIEISYDVKGMRFYFYSNS